MRSFCLLPFVLVFAACGDNGDDHHHKPDAAPPPDTAPDATVPLTCNYTEQADATNDDLFGPGTNAAEATGLSFANAPLMICGKLDPTNYQLNAQRVDVDSYMFTVPAASTGIVHLVAPGAESLDSLFMEVYGMTTNTSEFGRFVGTFATVSAKLPPGEYEITISSYNATAPAAAIDYKVIVQTDSPSRCAKSTAAANYTEALEGVAGGGNDVYEVRYSGQPRRKLTDLPTDMAEPTGITVAETGSSRISGAVSQFTPPPASWMDFYKDRDTYEVTVGENVNQLSVRLNWPGTTADLDFLVFPMGGLLEIANGYYPGDMEDEFATFAVTPGMKYLIFVGADDMSTLPNNYDLTLCGSTFTPPPTM